MKNMNQWNLVNISTEELLVSNLTKAEAIKREEKAHELGIPAMIVQDKDLEIFDSEEEATHESI